MPVTGPDFVSLQTRDLDASGTFYEHYLGLVRSQTGPPHAVVFDTQPIAFALRDVVPGTQRYSAAHPGVGAAIWLHATDVQAIHDALAADGHPFVSARACVCCWRRGDATAHAALPGGGRLVDVERPAQPATQVPPAATDRDIRPD